MLPPAGSAFFVLKLTVNDTPVLPTLASFGEIVAVVNVAGVKPLIDVEVYWATVFPELSTSEVYTPLIVQVEEGLIKFPTVNDNV